MAKRRLLTIRRTLPWLLIICAVIGLWASFTLTIEHINLLKDPNHQLNCDLNPILSCGPVMQSDIATQFGFPNPIIGLVAFSAQATLGITMLAGAKMKSWFWRLYGVAILVGLGFIFWLMYQSIFQIKAICIYCLISWVVMFITAWYVFQFMLAEKHITIKNKAIATFVRKYQLEIVISWFLLPIVLIIYEFWHFFGPKLGF